MNRTTALLVVASVLLAAAAAPLGAAMQPAPDGVTSDSASTSGTATLLANESTNNTTANDSASMAPGERLAGVFGVQQAEFEGSVEQRSFGVRIAEAASADAKAAVVANQTAELDRRLAVLEERKQRLEEAYENGSISKGQYQARMAALSAQTQTLTQLANATEREARQLPEDELREHGVNVTAIQQLQQHAKNLTGPEVAAIARTIAGPDIGAPVNVTRGPPADTPAGNVTVGNETGEASEQRVQQALAAAGSQIVQADRKVGRADSVVTAETGDAAAALERARSNLSAAKQSLADARVAADNGNYERALTLAQQAQTQAQAAKQHAQTAIELSGSATSSTQTTTTTRASA